MRDEQTQTTGPTGRADSGVTPPPAGVTPTPAAGTLAVLALAWLLAMLSSARYVIGDSPDSNPLTVTRAALELPQVISASLIAGIAVGLAATNLLARFAPAAAARPLPRFTAGTGGGAVTGLAVAAPILLGYGGLPSILVLSGAVAAAAVLGGLLTVVRNQAVVAAGTLGALGVFLVGLMERMFEPSLRPLFGAGDSPESVITASGWVVLTSSLVAGMVAGVLGYAYLRRCGPATLRWPAYLLAGAMPGLLVLLAELVARLGATRLVQLVSAASDGDRTALSYLSAARFNRALIVLFIGALVAIVLLGRTLRPPEPVPAAPAEPDGPDGPEPPESSGSGELPQQRASGMGGRRSGR